MQKKKKKKEMGITEACGKLPDLKKKMVQVFEHGLQGFKVSNNLEVESPDANDLSNIIFLPVSLLPK